MRLGLDLKGKGGYPPIIGFIFGIWPPPNERVVCGGSMPPGLKLGFPLVVGMEDEICNVMLGIPK